MAVTTIHPIRSTVELSIKYICSPDKTDGEILISSHGCGHKTADLDFKETWKRWNSASKIQARHLIQSFSPEDVVTPEKAHEIGEELMDKVLRGEYEYVMSTHIDKGHIHNHFIFNNVNSKTGKAYLSNKRTYHNMRNISDALCYENKLSVIEHTSGINGVSYKEVLERQKGTSWKAKLQYAIDNAIKRSNNWEEFLNIMESMGYEIKEGKHIAFRAKDQERFTRAKTIGEKYTKENIKNRIESRKEYKETFSKEEGGIKRIINTEGEKFQQEKGLMYWAKIQNLKTMASSLNQLSRYNIKSIDDLDKVLGNKNLDILRNAEEIKEIEWKIKELNKRKIAIRDYKKYRVIYKKYEMAKNKDKYYNSFTSEILLYKSARKKLEQPITRELLESIDDIEREVNTLDKNRQELMRKRNKSRDNLNEIQIIKDNIYKYLDKDLKSNIKGIER